MYQPLNFKVMMNKKTGVKIKASIPFLLFIFFNSVIMHEEHGKN
jgi:hypothetical protein